MPRLISICSAIAILCSAAAPARAQEPWQFQITPYIWASALEGDVATLPGVPPASVDASFSDLLSNLDFAFMIAGEAHNGQFGFFADLFYANIVATGSSPGPLYSTARLDAEIVYTTLTGFWRAWSDEGAFLDLMAGAKLWSVDTEMALGAGILAARTVSHDESWFDPVIGFKTGGPFPGSKFFHGAGVLVGGFGVGSDLMWDANINIGYQWTDGFSTSLGYRYLAVDYSRNEFLYDVAQHGPALSLSWRF